MDMHTILEEDVHLRRANLSRWPEAQIKKKYLEAGLQ